MSVAPGRSGRSYTAPDLGDIRLEELLSERTNATKAKEQGAHTVTSTAKARFSERANMKHARGDTQGGSTNIDFVGTFSCSTAGTSSRSMSHLNEADPGNSRRFAPHGFSESEDEVESEDDSAPPQQAVANSLQARSKFQEESDSERKYIPPERTMGLRPRDLSESEEESESEEAHVPQDGGMDLRPQDFSVPQDDWTIEPYVPPERAMALRPTDFSASEAESEPEEEKCTLLVGKASSAVNASLEEPGPPCSSRASRLFARIRRAV